MIARQQAQRPQAAAAAAASAPAAGPVAGARRARFGLLQRPKHAPQQAEQQQTIIFRLNQQQQQQQQQEPVQQFSPAVDPQRQQEEEEQPEQQQQQQEQQAQKQEQEQQHQEQQLWRWRDGRQQALAGEQPGQCEPGSTGGGDLHARMLPGPLTAAFIRMLKQHTAAGDTAAAAAAAAAAGGEALPHHHHHPHQQPDHGCTEELLAHAQQLAPQLLPRQASLVLYVCAKLRLPHEQQLQAALLQQLPPRALRQLPPAGLANTLWAVAVLDISPPGAWMEQLYHATAGAGALDEGDNGAGERAAVQAPSGSSGAGGGGAPPFAQYNPQQLVQLLWALGRLRQRPPAAWLQALLAALRPRLGGLTPPELTNTLWGLSQLGYRPGRAWVGAWLRASAASLAQAGPDCLASQVACIGLLRLELSSSRWLLALRAAVADQLPAMGPGHVATVMCGLAKRRAAQPPHWVLLLLRAQLRHVAAAGATDGAAVPGGTAAAAAPAAAAPCGLSPRDLAATVWALPLLLYPTAPQWARQRAHAPLLQRLVAASLPLLPRCSVCELLQLAVGFARLGMYPGAHWLKMHERAAAQHRLPLTDANRWRLRAAVRQLWSDG